MPHLISLPYRSGQVMKLLLILPIFVVMLSACLPESLEPSSENESLQDNVIEEISTPITEVTETTETIEVSPTATVSPTIFPDAFPQVLNGSTTTQDVVTRTISSVSVPETAYQFSSGRLVGVLSNDDLILQQANNLLGLLDLTDFSTTPALQNSILPILPFGENRDLIVPVDSANKRYPVWSVDLDSGETILLGTTTGYFPFFSSSADGKVLLLENGHLVIKWFDGQEIQSQILTALESSIDLKWSSYDLTQSPGTTNWDLTPWIDFELSPDGQWVALFDGLEAKIWIASVDGQIVQSIPIDPEILQQSTSTAIDALGVQIVFLGWSPDSQTLAYREGVWADKPGYRYQQIKLVSIDGFNVINLTSAVNSIGGTAAWSADGQYVAYALQPYSPPPDSNEFPIGSLLYVADSEGMNPVLVSNIFHLEGPSLFWLSDSSTLVYKCRLTESTVSICTTKLELQD